MLLKFTEDPFTALLKAFLIMYFSLWILLQKMAHFQYSFNIPYKALF